MNPLIRALIIFLLSISALRAQSDNFVFSPINVLQGLSDNQIRYILQLPDGRMVFKTSGNINIYDGVHFKYIHQTLPNLYPLNGYDGFYRIYQGKDSLLWIKDTHKLMCVDLRTEKYLSGLDSYFKKKGFKKGIDDLFMDSGQHLWFLYSGKLYKENSSTIIDLSANKNRLQDLMSRNNNLYLFYDNGEVICYDLKTKRKLYTIAAYPSEQRAFFKNTSLAVKGNNGFYQLRNGNKGGFFFFDTQKRIWKKILETNYTLNTLVVNSNDTAYISCTNGIWIINCRNGEKRYMPTLKKVDGSILNTEISTLFYDKQGGLWLGTLNQGLLYYHPSRYKFKYIGRSYFQKNASNDIIVQSFAQDQKGNVYIKSQSDIYQYHSSSKMDKVLTVVSLSLVPKEILEKLNQNNQTVSITDIRGWKWTGTQDGLKVFDPKKQKERFFYTKDGLSNNFIHALLEDHSNNIWVTTSYGITKLQIDPISNQIHFTNFYSDSGTLEGEYSDGAAFEAKDGTLYFGGINGFNILNKSGINSKKIPFSPLFTNLFLRGERVESGKLYDSHVIMNKTAPYTKEIKLSHNQNFLTFEYSALNYQNPSQTYYRYELEGVDNTWRETSIGGQNENPDSDGILKTSYTNLSPGKYKFKVMASNNNLQWNGLVSELNITINAPWWKTPIAYILFTSLFIAIIISGLYGYIYNTRKKMERNHREDILLVRIRNLIEQCDFLQSEKETYLIEKNENTIGSANKINENNADNEFLARALEQVEKNLEVSDYSVEQLSRDLCMDRTGLYRKLIALLDKSPSLFIRSIRLQRAAVLILEGKLNIAEITEKVGFSSSSYFSKCFQEMYGCRPSEYAEKTGNST
ncbi:transcriptional regulator [Flavobacterium cheongpyeongense]|uniref:Transcriptional regulator n=1 Tax=Flavobacterium cheongpyeongense TaxID=2212651 RepID=A0A2V4BJY9_9FLAO|nr:helix-turn-helix domain-containing protein [Flavobacterium cheongpyeongense]PXY39308.1 transcriptional regulator [Flavobacterium cheongpyeongense]